jgi:hypothetical protein
MSVGVMRRALANKDTHKFIDTTRSDPSEVMAAGYHET